MRNFLRRYYKTTGTDLFGFLILTIVLSTYIVYRNLFPEHNHNLINDYSLKPVSWVREEKEGVSYYVLERDQSDKHLLLICKDKKILIDDLKALSIIRFIDDDGRSEPLTSMTLNGRTFRVPVINENPNPTPEQVEFLRALSQAVTITFDAKGYKYTWTATNHTALADCVNL